MIKNYAHRGFSGEYPENTMLSFKKALEAGCDGIELDVHLSKDGEIVVIHDEKLDRTTDGVGFIKDYTYEELQTFNAAHLYERKYEAQHIPSLREYLEWVKEEPIITIIELKTNCFEYEGIEEKVDALIKEYGLQEKTLMCSFNHLSMQRMKVLNSTLKCALLVECWMVNGGSYTVELGMECIHPLYFSMTPDRVKEIKAQGIEINAWTVNEEEGMYQMIENGIDGVITNYPDKFNEIRSRKYAH